MGAEKKQGVKVETKIAPSLKDKFERKVKKNNDSMAAVLRNFIQVYVKK